MRHGIYLVPAAIVLTLGSLACKPPKTAEQIKAETQAAWAEGVQAFKDGKARETNPYLNDKENPHKATGWFAGWDQAKIDKAAADLGTRPRSTRLPPTRPLLTRRSLPMPRLPPPRPLPTRLPPRKLPARPLRPRRPPPSRRPPKLLS